MFVMGRLVVVTILNSSDGMIRRVTSPPCRFHICSNPARRLVGLPTAAHGPRQYLGRFKEALPHQLALSVLHNMEEGSKSPLVGGSPIIQPLWPLFGRDKKKPRGVQDGLTPFPGLLVVKLAGGWHALKVASANLTLVRG